MTAAAANVDRLEELRRQIRRGGLRTNLEGVARYQLGDLVWARWGKSTSVQLARITLEDPVALYGGAPEWWWVRIYWPRAAAWREQSTHRRVYRALHPQEITTLRAAGVLE